MFRWYRNATICYVYLADVPATDNSWIISFLSSRWFSRGWTLQELLAPASVEFFSSHGRSLGTKKSLEPQIQQVTGIPTEALRGDSLSQISINERMSWIANRETTVEEDIAYSLFGIFDIHMPLIYGEGTTKALRRLGEEIEKSLAFSQQSKPATLDRQMTNFRRQFVTKGTGMSTSATYDVAIIRCRKRVEGRYQGSARL